LDDSGLRDYLRPCQNSMSSSVLCIAHPGHELRVLQWLREARPVVLILTDGSGSSKCSRLEASRTLVQDAGGTVGRIFGRYPDRGLYEIIRNQDLAAVVGLADDLLATLEESNADVIAGDMLEGFNTGHDLCRMLIQAAVGRYCRRRGHPVKNYEIVLERLAATMAVRKPAVTLRLGKDEIAAKRMCVELRFPQLVEEMDRAVAKYGDVAVATETLFEAADGLDDRWLDAEPPYYETFGRKQVAAGLYTEVITHETHMRPLAQALQKWAAQA
jgi:hypothetical protein